MSLQVLALRYGLMDGPPSGSCQEGGPPPETLAMYVFLLHTPQRSVLVDTGFGDPELARLWQVREFIPVPDLLGQVGLAPDRITDVILTHGHWDRVGGLRDFMHARIWIARDELAAMEQAGRTEGAGPGDYRWEDLQVLGLAPRLQTFGRRRAIAPFARVAVVTGHTPGMLAVTVLHEGLPRLVLVGDNAWLYRHLEGSPMPTHSRAAGHDPLPRLRLLAGDAPLVPGRDPDLGRHYRQVSPSVVRLFP